MAKIKVFILCFFISLIGIVFGTLCMRSNKNVSNPENNAPFSKNNSSSLAVDRSAWGESQLRQMLKDRPAMTSYIKEGDDLWRWTVRQFAGEGGGGEVRWDPEGPEPPWDAQSCGPYPQENKLGWIKVSLNFAMDFDKYHKGDPKGGPVLWSMVLYEFFNIEHTQRNVKVNDRASKGLLSRTAYILEEGIQEYDTTAEAHLFFQNVWIPHCRMLNLPYEDEQVKNRMGFIYKDVDIEDAIDNLLNDENDHHKFFGDYWDKNYLKTFNRKKKAG